MGGRGKVLREGARDVPPLPAPRRRGGGGVLPRPPTVQNARPGRGAARLRDRLGPRARGATTAPLRTVLRPRPSAWPPATARLPVERYFARREGRPRRRTRIISLERAGFPVMASRGSRATSPPPVFGREETLEAAGRLLTRTHGGEGTGLLLIGLGGVGKTQILNAIVERAGKKGFTVLTGRALPEELPPAFSLLRELLGSERSEGSGARAPLWTPTSSPLLIPSLPDRPERPAAAAEGTTTSRADDFERVLAPLVLAEGLGAGRDELFARLEGHLLERARQRPLLIAVDDLHFADTSTLEFLRRFASELPKSPIAIAATLAESADVPERTREVIEAISGAPSFLTIPIRPLSVPETEDFVRWILGGRMPALDDVRRWHAQTDGNPLFLEQLVRIATGYGPPANDSGGAGQGVTEMLLDRVEGLGDRERRVLTYAAVLGKEFHFANLSAVAGSGEERVTESLDRLVHDGLVREKGGEVYEFVSEAVRRDLYAGLTETRRRILHARAGRAL